MGLANVSRNLPVATAATALTVATVGTIPAAAEQLLLVPTAKPPVPKSVLWDDFVDDFYHDVTVRIGSGLYPDAETTIVDYPTDQWPLNGLTAPRMGEAVEIGADNVEAAIREADGPIVVAGASLGAMVVNSTQARLAEDPTAPPADQVAFAVFGDPNYGNGILAQLPEGLFIPVFDVTVTRPVESQYDTIVVIGEYDPAADFPDRPWNLLALLNSALAGVFVHTPSPWFEPDDVPPENITVETNSRGGTTTTYFVPSDPLPLIQPLELIGMPEVVIDGLDDVLRPIVDAGYSRNYPKPADPKPADPKPASVSDVVEVEPDAAEDERPEMSRNRSSLRFTPRSGGEPAVGTARTAAGDTEVDDTDDTAAGGAKGDELPRAEQGIGTADPDESPTSSTAETQDDQPSPAHTSKYSANS